MGQIDLGGMVSERAPSPRTTRLQIRGDAEQRPSASLNDPLGFLVKDLCLVFSQSAALPAAS